MKRNEPAGIPTPKPGRAVAFNLTAEHHAEQVANPFGQLTADRSGNIYMAANTTVDGIANIAGDIVRLSPDGAATSFAVPGLSDPSSSFPVAGMTTTPDGDLLIGRDKNIYRLSSNGRVKAVIETDVPHPNPLGVRADGSIVVAHEGSLWSVANGKTSLLYKGDPDEARGIATDRGAIRGVADSSGTVYAAVGRYLPDVVVIPQGQGPHRWGLSGNVPGTSVGLSSLTPVSLAQSQDGGVYVLAASDFTTGHSTGYVLHVRDGKVQLLLKAAFTGVSDSCSPGQEYSLDHIPCALPWYVVQSGSRVLLLGGHHGHLGSVPLAISSESQ
ncbi:hypothetical protein [Streptantibioticus ferralitis]|uniref:Uncharacterized protein n=1 Tax=Streptantibioticus ferralitis TaxID=236510 RepID=A0ABT5Z3K8_9ACTN|nr:hypothetical protein [Streptantibioticus ferralitis]MDF2258415.1 hypothetical protein [Streptantibioticus ferralitis]